MSSDKRMDELMGNNEYDTCEFHDDFATPLLQVHPTDIAFGGEPAALCKEGADHIDLWYTGPGNRLHYGRSTDGIAFASSPTDIPEGYLRSTVLEKEGVYYLYCAARDRDIHLFTSRDKTHFESQGVALAGGVGSDRYVANMFVWVENGTWHMLYEAGQDDGPSRWVICLATSPTPTGFSQGRFAAHPVLTSPGMGCGNPELARIGSRVIRDQGRYWLLYHRGENWRAWSTDLHSWTQEGVIWGYDKTDPVGYSCGDASLCQFRNRTYIWKSLSDQVSSCRMVVAIADMPLREFLRRDVPISAADWEDASPGGGYPRYPDVDTTLSRTGSNSIFLNKPYWRDSRGVAIRHPYRPSGPVVVSVWFHDDASDHPAQGHVAVTQEANAHPVSVGIDTTVSATHYVVLYGGKRTAAAIPRVAGWHEVEFIVQDNGTEVSVDGACVGRDAAITTATMSSVALWSSKDMPANVSVDSVAIRGHW